MSARIMLECPACRRVQALKNQKCVKCGKGLRRLRNKEYWVDFHDQHGKQRREKVGQSLQGAEDKAAEYQTDVKRGVYYRNDITFGELADLYMESPKTKALKSYNRIEKALKHLRADFGDLPISRITPDAINGYLQKRVGETSNRKVQTSICTANREVSYMRAIFNFGIANDLINRYPFGRGRVQFFDERTKARTRYISEEELVSGWVFTRYIKRFRF